MNITPENLHKVHDDEEIKGFKTKLSEFENDGADGENPFITKKDIPDTISEPYDVALNGTIGDGIAYDAEAIENTINDAADYSTIIIGTNNGENFLLDRPVKVTSPNKHIIINGNTKLIDGVTRPVTSDVALEATKIDVVDADQYFRVGQQLAIVDDDGQQLYGKYYGCAVEVAEVSATQITFTQPVNLAFTVAKNVRIGHYQSAFVVQANNVHFSGHGTIDCNANPEQDIYGMRVDEQHMENADFGCGISFAKGYNITNVSVKGIKIKNAVLHNISLWEVTNYILDDIKLENTFNKNILFFNTENGFVDNIYIDGSLYEDGLSFYSQNKNIRIGKAIIKNCERYGIFISKTSTDITCVDYHSINNKNNRICRGGVVVNNMTVDNEGDVLPAKSSQLWITQYNGYITENIVIDNFILKNNNMWGIYLEGNVHNVIIKNIIAENLEVLLVAEDSANVKFLSGVVQNVQRLNTLFGTSVSEFRNIKLDGVTDLTNQYGDDTAHTKLIDCEGIDNVLVDSVGIQWDAGIAPIVYLNATPLIEETRTISARNIAPNSKYTILYKQDAVGKQDLVVDTILNDIYKGTVDITADAVTIVEIRTDDLGNAFIEYR